MKNLTIIAGLALVLGGCAQTIWLKPGASQQDFVSDQYSCNRDTHQSGHFGEGLIGAINMQEFYDSCMNAHGWYAQKK